MGLSEIFIVALGGVELAVGEVTVGAPLSIISEAGVITEFSTFEVSGPLPAGDSGRASPPSLTAC